MPTQTLQQRRVAVERGIHALLRYRLTDAARELEGVLLDLDAQLLGLDFPHTQETHGEAHRGSVE